MNVSLTPELESFISGLLSRGQYGSQSEVVRAALRLLLHEEEERKAKLAALREDVAVGFGDLSRGRGLELSAEEIKERVMSATRKRAC